MGRVRIIDVTDESSFALVPPCADPGFDHRSCDHWENADGGSRAARLAWLSAEPAAPARPARPAASANPFAPPATADDDWNPFRAGPAPVRFDPFATEEPGDPIAVPAENPFAPPPPVERGRTQGVPRKLALLDRGRGVFGSYAKVLLDDDAPAAYAQFGPLSAYPRAQRLRELYPSLPASPLPAVITCIASTPAARGKGHARRLVRAVCDDLAARGFAAVEAYPDRSRPADATSAATPAFWVACGFAIAIDDERYPVLRIELD